MLNFLTFETASNFHIPHHTGNLCCTLCESRNCNHHYSHNLCIRNLLKYMAANLSNTMLNRFALFPKRAGQRQALQEEKLPRLHYGDELLHYYTSLVITSFPCRMRSMISLAPRVRFSSQRNPPVSEPVIVADFAGQSPAQAYFMKQSLHAGMFETRRSRSCASRFSLKRNACDFWSKVPKKKIEARSSEGKLTSKHEVTSPQGVTQKFPLEAPQKYSSHRSMAAPEL